MRLRISLQCAVLLGVVMMTRPAYPAEDFYRTQLRLGSDAYRAQKFEDAADQLRLACFGLLDDPPRLSEALAMLALSQSALGRAHDVAQTLDRFVDVEKRFQSYSKAALDEDTRKAFDAFLLKSLAPDVRSSVPTLASIGPTRMDSINALPPREKRKALEAEASKHPDDVVWPLALARDAAARNDNAAVVQYATRALAIDASNAAALELRARGRFARRDYKGAFADFTLLPDSRFAEDETLVAQRFVSAVEAKALDAARELAPRLSDEVLKREDVARAKSRLAAATAEPQQRKASEKKTGEKKAEEPAASPAVSTPAPPAAAAPVAAPKPAENNLPVTARNRGPNSFTTDEPSVPPGVVDDALARSRKLVARGRYADAERILYEALRKDSTRRDARLALLEASCLAGDWQTGSAQVALLQPFKNGEETSMFYAAASYFELGRAEEARVLLRLALPGLAPGEMVDRYSRRILQSGD